MTAPEVVRPVIPVAPREWTFMGVRALAVVALSIAVVAITIDLAAPATTPWAVLTSGTASAQSRETAAQVCATVGNEASLTKESYVLGAAIPTTLQDAESWVAGAKVTTTAPAVPAVVCVVHTKETTFENQPLTPNIVTVVTGIRSVRRYFMAGLPTQHLIESNVPRTAQILRPDGS